MPWHTSRPGSATSKLRSTEKQPHGQPILPNIHLFTSHVLREASCHGELGEGTSYICSFLPFSVLCILSFAQTCEHPNSAGFQTRLMSESTAGKNTGAAGLHAALPGFHRSPNCLLISQSFWVFCFPGFEVSHSQLSQKGFQPPTPP